MKPPNGLGISGAPIDRYWCRVIPTFKKATILWARSAVRCMPVLDGNRSLGFPEALYTFVFCVEEFGFEVFQPDPLSGTKLRACPLHPIKKARVAL